MLVRQGDVFLALVAILVIDQSAKLAVVRAGRTLEVGPFIRIRWIRSRSALTAAFGAPTPFLVLAWLGIALFVLVATTQTGPFGSALSRVALGAALGGAASNTLDQVRRGFVVDYLDLRVWPVFNLADAAIVLGVIVAFVAH